MGVFGAFFGRRGDAGFKAPLLGASSGVVGFNVAALSCLVREKVRPARSKHPKIGVLSRAGRTFSRKCRWRGRAGRVFSHQPTLRRSWMQRRALQDGCRWGFCSIRNWLPACRRRGGASCSAIPPPFGDGETVMFDVCPAVSHAIPLWLFQDLNWHRWNCNDSGGC